MMMLILDFELEENDWIWDENLILGIPIFHSVFTTSLRTTTMSTSCIIIPIFKKEDTENKRLTSAFCKGYDEFCYLI